MNLDRYQKTTAIIIATGVILGGMWGVVAIVQGLQTKDQSDESIRALAITINKNISEVVITTKSLQSNLETFTKAMNERLNKLANAQAVSDEKHSHYDKFIETATPAIHNNTARSLTNAAKIAVMK